MRKWLRTKKIKRKISARRKILRQFSKNLKTKELTYQNIEKYKKSDTLCVLASGKSINDISKSQWDFISSKDSVSLNNTILHPFIPTYLFYETDSDQDRHRRLNELKFDNLFKRSTEFQSVPIIWHYQEKRYFDIKGLIKHDLFTNSYFQTSYSLPGDTSEDFYASLKYVSKENLTDEIDVGLYRRGSLARILHFATALNYKKIIFFGADLTGADYFFDSYKSTDLPNGCVSPNLKEYTYNSSKGLKKQNNLHMTVDKSVHPVTMIDAINEINKAWLIPKGISLKVASSSSALSSIISVQEWH